MPRIKLSPQPEQESQRRDTIGLRTIVKYDPMAPRPTTPIVVDQYVVARRPLSDSIYTLYMILDGATIVGTQISYPSEDDCAAAVRRHRQHQAASMTDIAVAKAKTKRNTAANREEVTA
ncbi:beta-hexosaminidase [Paraburkholderia sp. EG287B]|uniref:beta-hexosaminidase n=1 Tax=Paraburkholderia sp. EG287B TaxID=3237010 RepID=UPI0034D1CC48